MFLSDLLVRHCFTIILWPNRWWLLRGVLAGNLLGLRATELLIRLLLLLYALTTTYGIVGRRAVGHRVIHLFAQVVPLSLLVLKHLLDGLGNICFIVVRCCDSRSTFASWIVKTSAALLPITSAAPSQALAFAESTANRPFLSVRHIT